MRLFYKKDGGVVQLIDKEKMKDWPVELPLIFIEYIRSNLLQSYEEIKVKKDIEHYLDEILEDVAIPRLIDVLEGNDDSEIITALKRIEELAKKKIELVKPIKPYIDKLMIKDSKEILDIGKKIIESFAKAEKRKNLAEKRKIMQQKEKDFLAGKINGEEYAQARKVYLILKE